MPGAATSRSRRAAPVLAGGGSALTEKETVEMEVSIMDGRGRRCGAVSGLTTVKNPISLSRLVMDKSPHSYLAFAFSGGLGLALARLGCVWLWTIALALLISSETT
uniref:Uncharacterized protein n=1 Tax=Kalanchoe fedtschenkoi TaxID=63787 RepID=A0A7N0U9M3_KALFE